MQPGKRFHPLLMAGFVFLILASISRWIKPHTTGGQDWSDAITGLLYGLAIACMLLGIVKTSRKSAEPPKQV